MEPSVKNLGRRFGFAAVLAVAFFGLLGFAATMPAAMATPILGAIPLSLVLAFAMIVFSIAITGTYVLIANKDAR